MFNNLLSCLLILLLPFTSVCFSSEFIEKDESIRFLSKMVPKLPINKVEFTNLLLMRNLYQLLKDTHELFEKNNIIYWADGGTLLGCVRHKGIIPWDDDLDIAIDTQDVPKLQVIKPQLEELGYELVMGPWLKIQSNTGIIDPRHFEEWDKELRSPWLDIFLFKIDNMDYIHASQSALEKWPKDKFTVDSIIDRELSIFGSFKIWIPFNAEKQLLQFYGEDALTHGVWEGNHDIDSTIGTYKWKLQECDKFPAELKNELENRVKDQLNLTKVDIRLTK